MKTAAPRSRLKLIQEVSRFLVEFLWNQPPIELIMAAVVVPLMATVLFFLVKLLTPIAIPALIAWSGFLIGTALFKVILGLFRVRL